ncbi:MAG: sulfurtransferase-like selenium metabolism protein YedF [Syntrophomonadaceae bacterium]
MRHTLDARGLACPQPEMMTENLLALPDITRVLTIVDDPAALEGIQRLVEAKRLGSSVEEQEGSFFIDIVKETVRVQKENVQGSTVILIKSNILGDGNDSLGSVLMQSFLYTLTQMDVELKSLLLLNSAVLLTTAGSQLITCLKQLERNGTDIVSCGTCLEFYGLLDRLEVGRVGNMYAMVEAMMQANKVIVL